MKKFHSNNTTEGELARSTEYMDIYKYVNNKYEHKQNQIKENGKSIMIYFLPPSFYTKQAQNLVQYNNYSSSKNRYVLKTLLS